MSDTLTVFVVDDDAAVRAALAQLLTAAGYAVETYDCAEAFLRVCCQSRAGCLVLDLQLPDMSGLDLQTALRVRGVQLPVIFLTAYGDVPTTVCAFKSGAFDLLEKPAEGGALLACVRRALCVDAERRRQQAARDAVRRRCAALTGRERELVPLIVSGHSCKDIARTLGISHRTVELHRARILRKLGVKSVVELAALAQALGGEFEVASPGDTTGQADSADHAADEYVPRCT